MESGIFSFLQCTQISRVSVLANSLHVDMEIPFFPDKGKLSQTFFKIPFSPDKFQNSLTIH